MKTPGYYSRQRREPWKGLWIVFTYATKIIATLAALPCWCTKRRNQTKALSASRMVSSMIVGCASKSRRDKGVYSARVPSIVTNYGKKAKICLENDHVGFRR